jgi:hypothetical protein
MLLLSAHDLHLRSLLLKLSVCCVCSYTGELLKHIDAENLPSCYGGTANFDWEEHEKPKQVYK